MKRKGGFFDKLCTIENIELADYNARKGKTKKQKSIAKHDLNHDIENQKLLQSFIDGTFKTSKYKIFKIYEPKEREIFELPYYPDRIAHHAIMNVVKEYWTSLFITNTYSCIEGRGIHKCLHDLRRDLKKTKYTGETVYCLKFDITKFYPSINHSILKKILERKIKDKKFLNILFNIIDSTNGYTPKEGVGVPIGNYLSQFFANLYLTEFDHWCKEILHCKYYYRYADDIVILGSNKSDLRLIFTQIQEYLLDKLELKIKPNYQIFPVEDRGIDFVGYLIRHDYCLLRKSIKHKINLLLTKYSNKEISFKRLTLIISAYVGWLKHCNSKHLLEIIECNTNISRSNFEGKRVLVSKFKKKDINIVNVEVHNKYYIIEFIYNNKTYKAKSKDKQYLFL